MNIIHADIIQVEEYIAQPMTKSQLEQLIGTLTSADGPQNFKLTITKQKRFSWIPLLLKAMENDNFPSRFEFDFSENKIGDEGARLFAEALIFKQGKRSIGFKLHLRSNKIGDNGAQALAESLKSKNYPENFVLNLRYNAIGAEGAKAFAEALQSGRCPSGFVLDLRNNPIGIEGARAFAGALATRQYPENLTIDLSYTRLTDAGMLEIIRALNPDSPRNLRINMKNDFITDFFIKYEVAHHLKENGWPAGLTLDFSRNEGITDQGAYDLIEALGIIRQYYGPIHIDLSATSVTLEMQNQFKKAITAYEQRFKRLSSAAQDQNIQQTKSTDPDGKTSEESEEHRIAPKR